MKHPLQGLWGLILVGKIPHSPWSMAENKQKTLLKVVSIYTPQIVEERANYPAGSIALGIINFETF